MNLIKWSEQEKVLKSILPIFPSQDVEQRIGTPIPSVTIAAMYPFIFDSIKDPGLSTLLGVDFSGGVILFNQFLYKIRKENDLIMQEKRERAQNTHVVYCPYCGSEFVLKK